MSSKCSCGAVVGPADKFCGQCGRLASGWGTCPFCRQEVELQNFCPECGKELGRLSGEFGGKAGVWSRGADDFAVNLSTEWIERNSGDTLVIRHGTKALVFEDGNLVEEVTSGRHSTQQGGLISRLFKKPKAFDVMLVDAGDVPLHFAFSEIKTRDGMFVDIDLDLMVKLVQPSVFFLNVIKEQRTYRIFELRQLIFKALEGSLRSGIVEYRFEDLSDAARIKTEIASRIDAALRETLRRIGLEITEVRSWQVSHEKFGALEKQAADDQVEAAGIRTRAAGKKELGGAEAESADVDRDLRRGRHEGRRADIGLDGQERDLDNLEKQTLGDKEIAGKLIDVDLYRRRIEVRKAVLAADSEKIKNEEDFRKFQMEVDRERALDASEWEAFADELLQKGEDRRRDRTFLVAKVQLQQDHDLAMISLANRSDLSLEQKKRQAAELGKELEWQLERALRKVRGEADIRVAQAELSVKEQRIVALGQTQIQVEQQLMEIRLAKEKDLARHERAKLEIEEKRLKSQLGMENLERIKLIKAAEKDRDQVRELERQQKGLEVQLAREEAEHKREMEKRRTDHASTMDRYGAMAGMGIEQLIAIAGGAQAGILGDLAQSKNLKGMDAEQILAMKDPAALGRALEERARNTSNDDLKAMYERMLALTQASADQIAAAHRQSADRSERMFNTGMGGAAAKNQQLVDAERYKAGMAERMAGSAMGNMKEVSTAYRAQTAEPPPEAGGRVVHRCANCKQDVPEGKNFCPNCGEKMY